MGIEHLTIVTCDRCNTKVRSDQYVDRGWQTDWASIWPEMIAPYGEYPPYTPAHATICTSCLSDAEREELADTRARLQAADEQIPY